ncbi:hypothetical protein QBC34DRAFT_337366 [Podospora aff. communis PSN243]|uniref:N-acetyltransferase domain-containing protein n=1 Tax=Podospora aff. communis PSN243 TaxID=3040156 RepID=A0AAV9G4X9_9PEZI|nr:hypothetical protein QBC34DRAFT_337366 [Podospora aff. communis PSN243]
MKPPNPSPLPARFQIRKIDAEHLPWVRAIFAHSNILCSPLWSVALPQETRIDRVYKFWHAMEELMRINAIDSYSYGVWDTEYQFKRPESVATGGKLYWDETNLDATPEELLEQMDFPLVSVAVAYDGFKKPDMAVYNPIIKLVPLFGQLHHEMEKRDTRREEDRKPKREGEMIFRSGTATRRDYAGYGIAKGLGHWLMREVAGYGFGGMQIGVAHEALVRVFMNPPEPFVAEVAGEVDLRTFEVGEEGRVVRPTEVCGDVPFKMIVVKFR